VAEYPSLMTLGILLILSPFVKSLMERVGVPALVGYILLGLLVGITDSQWDISSPLFNNTFTVLAELGVVALLFRVGLKSHTQTLLAKLPDATFIWIFDVLTNFLLVFCVAHFLLSAPLESSLVIATAFSSTSVAVTVAAWSTHRRLNSASGQLLVDVAELDSLSSVLILAILLAIIPAIQGDQIKLMAPVGLVTILILLKLMLFITGCYLFSHYFERSFTQFNRRWENSKTAMTISVLGAGLVIAALAGYLGFPLAIGALFAGLAFSRDPEAVRTDTRFAYFYEFFTPFFFIYIGMQLEPSLLVDSLGIAAILLLPAVVGKLAGVGIPALRFLKKREAFLLGISMIPRAEIAMVVVYQCHLLGKDVIPDRLFGAMVAVSVITSILAPIALRVMLVRSASEVKK
jgi:Kef-type K+ transport system membrane component KefB